MHKKQGMHRRGTSGNLLRATSRVDVRLIGEQQGDDVYMSMVGSTVEWSLAAGEG